MPEFEKERNLIKLAEEATFSSQEQTFNSLQNLMETQNDIILQEAARENTKLVGAFRMNALWKAGVPLDQIEEIQPPLPTPPQSQSLLKTVGIPALLATVIGASAFGIGKSLNKPNPTLPVMESENGSLFQYLQDNSYHLKDN